MNGVESFRLNWEHYWLSLWGTSEKKYQRTRIVAHFVAKMLPRNYCRTAVPNMALFLVFSTFFLFYFCFAHHRVEFKNEKSQQASFWVTLPLWEKKNASEKKAGVPLRRIIPLHEMAPGAGRHHLYSFCLAARVYTVELTMVWLLLIHSGLGVVLFVSDTAILDNSVE